MKNVTNWIKSYIVMSASAIKKNKKYKLDSEGINASMCMDVCVCLGVCVRMCAFWAAGI